MGGKQVQQARRLTPSWGIPTSFLVVYSLLVCHKLSLVLPQYSTPTQWWFAVHRMSTHHPPPLPDTAPRGIFSEARAMHHVRVLADDHPIRQIGTPGAAAVADYILRYGQELQAHAARHRPDLRVEALQDTSSGVFGTSFSGVAFTSVYFDVHNVMYRLTPAHAHPASKAVVINAHFDNSQGTPGASDCASCVGVAMEVASTLVHNASLQLDAPIIFLLNGGEETLFQGAHAFLHSPHVPSSSLGAFINLESTGPGGFDALIQHRGAWTAEAYARAAPFPRGAMWSQDQLDLHVIPGSTDFVVLGEVMPGVDVAFLLDAAAYHTKEDKVTRIKPGWLQSMGVNTLAVAAEFARVLAAEAAGRAPNASLGGHAPSAARDKAILMDYFGLFMWTLDVELIHLLRALPLVLALSLPGLLHMLHGKGPVVGAYLAMLSSFARSVAALTCAALVGGGLMGAGRVWLFGTPMVWFGSHTLTCVVFLPAACAGAALPYLLAPCPPYPAYMAGYTLLAALVAYLACGLGVGGGLFFTVAALGACTMLLVDGRGSFCSTRSALLAHALNTFPLSLSVSACFFGIRHVLEKLTFVGHAPPPATAYAQDVGVGVLLSLVLYFHVALVVPFVLVNLRGEAPRVMAACLLLSLLVAAWASVARGPYSPALPKRVWMQHLSDVDATTGNASHRYVLGSWDNIPCSAALPEGAMNRTPLNHTGREWLSLPFLRDHLLTEVFPAPPPHPALDILAAMQRGSVEQHPRGVRQHYVLHVPSSSHASLVFLLPANTTRISAWSFTDTPVHTAAQRPGWAAYSVWLTGASSPRAVPLWVDLEAVGSGAGIEGVLEVSLSTLSMPSTELHSISARMPDWTSVVQYETFQTVMPL